MKSITPQESIAAFMTRHGITMDVERVKSNPHMLRTVPEDGPDAIKEAKWEAEASHWCCTFKKGRATLKAFYSMGSGHRVTKVSRGQWVGAPSGSDVLDCLASDAGGIENCQSFEDWASGYGYSPDSRKAEKVYQLCRDEADKLRRFLGNVDFDFLLNKVERL